MVWTFGPICFVILRKVLIKNLSSRNLYMLRQRRENRTGLRGKKSRLLAQKGNVSVKIIATFAKENIPFLILSNV